MTDQTTHDVMVAQTAKAQELLDYWQGQRADHESRLAAKEVAFDAFIANARNEYGHVCVTPNQAMIPNGTNDGIDQLSHSGLDLTIVEHAQVVLGSASAQPTSEATNFLNDINQPYSNKHFKVLDITWNTTGAGRFHDWRPTGPLTHAAYIKPLETANGALDTRFVERASLNNGWGLYGWWDHGALNAHHGPLVLSGNGRMLMALYGSVTGFASLENNRWTLFPYLAP